MSDENLQELIRDANYEKVVVAARRTKKLSIIKDLKLTLSPVEVIYLYRLRFNGGRNRILYFYAQTLEALSQLLIDRVDDVTTWHTNGHITLPNLGFNNRQDEVASPYEFNYGSVSHCWKLSKIPAIHIGGSTVILSQSPMTPYFKVQDTEKFLKEVGNKTKRLQECNRQASEARQLASQAQSSRDRERHIKQLRSNRLEAFKEALKISCEVAAKYRDAIKDDPEFTRISQILLDRAK